MNKTNRGITLIALVITIIVLLIISTIGITVGTDTYQSAAFTAFTTEMKMMQTEVNSFYQKYQNGDNSVLQLGVELTNSEKENKAFTGANITEKNGYRYFNRATMENLRIEGIKQEFLVNIEKRSIISYEGFTYQNRTYYTMEQLPDNLYNVEYTNPNTGEIIVQDVKVAAVGENSWKISLEGLQYPGYVDKGIISYQKEGDKQWKQTTESSFIVNELGNYWIKIQDGNGNTKVVDNKGNEYDNGILMATIYITDGLVLQLDAQNNDKGKHNTQTTIWKDLSGKGNDATLYHFNQNSGSGWKEKSLKFDGKDDYAEITNNRSLEVGNQTIELVIKQDAIVNNARSIVLVKWTGYTIEFNPNSLVTYGRNNGRLFNFY